jgi:uncharacterized metal-binding protein
MHGEFPAFEGLYGGAEQLTRAYHAAVVEAEGYCEWTRLREVAEYASRLGITLIGMAHCADMTREANLAALYLRSRSFEVLLPPRSEHCDPLAQVEFFAAHGVQLHVICGMRVSHEALLIASSEVPVVALVARDVRLRHNPVAALYTSGSYSRTRLFGEQHSAQWADFRGSGRSELERVALELAEDEPQDHNRMQEAMRFAQKLGARRIGISFCVGFQHEARLLAGVLVGNGFQVSSVCCKAGAVPKERLGIAEVQKVRPGQAEMICNPLAQAELLNRDAAQFTLSLGQCVGHEGATLGALDGAAICLVAKDRVLAHNSVAALYELEAKRPG